MARIEGVDLPRNKRVEVALTYIYGIGPTRARDIISQTKMNPDTRVKDLTENDSALLREFISKNYKVEGDLRREVQMNIKRLIEIGCYRGLRHRRNLPVHGQRTRTNARTRKVLRRRLPVAVAAVELQRNNGNYLRDREGAFLPAAAWLPGLKKIKRLVRNYGSKRTLDASHNDCTQGEAHIVFGAGAYLCLIQQYHHHRNRPAGEYGLLG